MGYRFRVIVIVVILVGFIISLFLTYLLSSRFVNHSVYKTCGNKSNYDYHPQPYNIEEFENKLSIVLNKIRDSAVDWNNSSTNHQIICTSVNTAAAVYNLPVFLKSLSISAPTLLQSTIIFCVEFNSCQICGNSTIKVACIYLDLGISGKSLAPGGNDNSDLDYWRLTYGRVYATKLTHSKGFSVLPVDVDSIFLKNPFLPGNEIMDHPNDISVVSDHQPFSLNSHDKMNVINGGLLYFPYTTPSSIKYTLETLDLIWRGNCKPKMNEQIITSRVLRHLSRKYWHRFDPYHPQILSNVKYLNFCNTKCGTMHGEFESVQSVAGLLAMERRGFDQSCSKESRNQWVFFHAACIKWPNNEKDQVAEGKMNAQLAILQWIKGFDYSSTDTTN